MQYFAFDILETYQLALKQESKVSWPNWIPNWLEGGVKGELWRVVLVIEGPWPVECRRGWPGQVPLPFIIFMNDLDDNVVNIVSTLANDMQIGLEEHKLNAHNIFSQIKGL